MLFLDTVDLRHAFTATTDQTGHFTIFAMSNISSALGQHMLLMLDDFRAQGSQECATRPVRQQSRLPWRYPSNLRICAATLSSAHIATQVLPHISIDESPLGLTVEPRQIQRKK